MNNMVIAIFERLKNLDDEWQFVDTPNDAAEESADPHMSTPKPSPSPIPTSENIPSTDEKEQTSVEKIIDDKAELTESPKTELPTSIESATPTEITAGKTLYK
jgi:brefeldin A-resistance guanine nucleotide exchange factor 1